MPTVPTPCLVGDGDYSGAYSRIRRCNLLIQNSEKYPNEAEEYATLGEAYFLPCMELLQPRARSSATPFSLTSLSMINDPRHERQARRPRHRGRLHNRRPQESFRTAQIHQRGGETAVSAEGAAGIPEPCGL